MPFHEVGASLEGRVLKGKARKLTQAPPERCAILGGLLHVHVLRDSVHVTVKTALRRDDIYRAEESHKQRGDRLEAYRVNLLTSKPLKPASRNVKKGSSTHKTQFFNTKNYAHAVIAASLHKHT